MLRMVIMGSHWRQFHRPECGHIRYSRPVIPGVKLATSCEYTPRGLADFSAQPPNVGNKTDKNKQ